MTSARADCGGAELVSQEPFGATLPGANLFEADLSRVDVSDASFTIIDLSRGNLSHGYIGHATLAGANRRRDNLEPGGDRGANPRRADLLHTVLEGADFPRVVLPQDDARWLRERGCNE